jgi:hypothetical protein
MKLIEVVDGHYFVKKSDPSQIFKRIFEQSTPYLANNIRNPNTKVRVVARNICDNTDQTFYNPELTEVIYLGE